jgi:hypothetical protein
MRPALVSVTSAQDHLPQRSPQRSGTETHSATACATAACALRVRAAVSACGVAIARTRPPKYLSVTSHVFEIMQRFAHRVESQPAMAPITKATIRDVSMIFPPIRFDNSSLTRVPSHRHGDRGIASPGKDFTKICRVAICGMETPAKWNYSPARLGCPAALNTA